MKALLNFTFVLFSLCSFSQDVDYFYDAGGNRIQRKLCLTCRKGTPDSTLVPIAMINRSLNANIQPNPTKGKLEVNVTQEEMNFEVFQILVYDVYGREVRNVIQHVATFNIDLSNVVSGIYYVKLIADEKIKEWKITKN